MSSKIFQVLYDSFLVLHNDNDDDGGGGWWKIFLECLLGAKVVSKHFVCIIVPTFRCVPSNAHAELCIFSLPTFKK